MGYNYDEFKEFCSSFEQLTNKYDQFIERFLLDMALRAMAMTIKKTPVDTGALRQNYFISGVFRKGADELCVEVANRKDYASYIESGHRLVKGTRYQRADGRWITVKEDGWQEGIFMLKLSVEQIQREMPARYERAFKSFCSGLGFDI